MKRFVAFPLLMLALFGEPRDQRAAGEAALSEALAEQMAAKVARITARAERAESKGAGAHNPPVATVLREEEINSYFEYRMNGKIPSGVSQVHFQLQPERPLATALVNFDQVKAASNRPIHPLLDALLRGQHPVAIHGHFTSSNGSGLFRLEEVSIGSLTLRGALLDLLIQRYVQPRYPQAAINRPFALPAKIERMTVEQGRVLVQQR